VVLVFLGGVGTVAGQDASTEKWNYTTGDDVFSSPTVVSGTVYVGSDDDSLYAIDAETGDEEWNYTTGDDVRSSPTVVDGTVYVGSYDDNLYAINTDHNKSSEGSRVLQGTLGHHNSFAENGPTEPGGGGFSVDDYRVNPNNPNSAVEIQGLQTAIQDFVSQNIDLSLLQDVIDEFIST